MTNMGAGGERQTPRSCLCRRATTELRTLCRQDVGKPQCFYDYTYSLNNCFAWPGGIGYAFHFSRPTGTVLQYGAWGIIDGGRRSTAAGTLSSKLHPRAPSVIHAFQSQVHTLSVVYSYITSSSETNFKSAGIHGVNKLIHWLGNSQKKTNLQHFVPDWSNGLVRLLSLIWTNGATV